MHKTIHIPGRSTAERFEYAIYRSNGAAPPSLWWGPVANEAGALEVRGADGDYVGVARADGSIDLLWEWSPAVLVENGISFDGWKAVDKSWRPEAAETPEVATVDAPTVVDAPAHAEVAVVTDAPTVVDASEALSTTPSRKGRR